MLTVYLILVNHFFADFIFQNDKMALQKSKSIYWLSIHVLVYTLCMGATAIGLYALTKQVSLSVLFLVVNGALHWITDYFTSRLNSRLAQLPTKHWFFVGIGFDQLVHYACLLFSWEYCINHV